MKLLQNCREILKDMISCMATRPSKLNIIPNEKWDKAHGILKRMEKLNCTLTQKHLSKEKMNFHEKERLLTNLNNLITWTLS